MFSTNLTNVRSLFRLVKSKTTFGKKSPKIKGQNIDLLEVCAAAPRHRSFGRAAEVCKSAWCAMIKMPPSTWYRQVFTCTYLSKEMH